MAKRSYSDHTLKLKAEVLRRLEHESATKLCKIYSLAPSTISTWKKRKAEIFDEVLKSVQPDRKRMRFSKYGDVEKALLYWLKDMRSRDHPPPIDSKIMMRQAERFASELQYQDWVCSRGFLQRFCKRYAVVSKRICGEANDCADITTFTDEVLLPLLLKFDPEDIYNADETSLYYKLLPSRTYAFRGEQVIGGRSSKDRLTLMLCSNMNGTDKLKPLIIGKTKNPRVLKSVYNMSTADLPVHYYSSANGWMTGFIFNSWLSKWNSKLARDHRNVLLLLDNAPSHVVENYSNITIQFLPPNTTSKLQPMDQGVLRLVKLGYRSRIADHYLDGVQNNEHAKDIIKKLDLKVACDFVCAAWKKVNANTIQNCFSKAGFVQSVPLPAQEDPHPHRNVWEHIQDAFDMDIEFESYATSDDSIETSQHMTESEIVQAVMNDHREHIEEEPEVREDQNADPEPNNFLNSAQESLDVIRQLRAYFQRNNLNSDNIDQLEQQVLDHKIATNSRQTKVTQFFRRS